MRGFGMKTIAAVLLGLGMIGCLELVARTQEKKDEKKDDNKGEKKDDNKDKKDDKKVEAPVLEGKYKLVAGKINDKAIGDDAKKWDYTFTADKITIKGLDEKKDEKKEEKKDEKKENKTTLMFTFSYKLDPKTNPINIEMEILDGPEGTKGIKAGGIIELKDEVLKLAYIMEKDKRPKAFDGKEGNMFELKRMK
jgi:uncharacterized protein (TIGR03067 family)